jgi:hypothetical protein
VIAETGRLNKDKMFNDLMRHGAEPAAVARTVEQAMMTAGALQLVEKNEWLYEHSADLVTHGYVPNVHGGIVKFHDPNVRPQTTCEWCSRAGRPVSRGHIWQAGLPGRFMPSLGCPYIPDFTAQEWRAAGGPPPLPEEEEEEEEEQEPQQAAKKPCVRSKVVGGEQGQQGEKDPAVLAAQGQEGNILGQLAA